MKLLKTITVYVVGFEPDQKVGGVGGFNWYNNKGIADQDYMDTLKLFMNSSETVYQGTIEIEVAEDYTGTEEQREDITNRIEEFLHLNDWENAFNEAETVIKINL